MQKLYKGIFWIKDVDDPYERNVGGSFVGNICFKIRVDENGTIIEKNTDKLNSKNKDNYNHKKTWQTLNKTVTGGKSFDYYPRGRVEIKHGKAIVYANPQLCNWLIMDWVMKEFGLKEENGIKQVLMKPDYSVHYRCYLDERT